MLKGLKEVYQRFFKSKTPTYFKRILYACITFLAAPELLIIVTNLIDEPQYVPSFISADWFKLVRGVLIGAGLVSKMTVHWGETDLKKIPDVTKPVEVIINETNGNVQT